MDRVDDGMQASVVDEEGCHQPWWQYRKGRVSADCNGLNNFILVPSILISTSIDNCSTNASSKLVYDQPN